MNEDRKFDGVYRYHYGSYLHLSYGRIGGNRMTVGYDTAEQAATAPLVFDVWAHDLINVRSGRWALVELKGDK